MNNNIKISVIIPTHNRNELLKRSIDSVISQTYPVHEIIIVDDAKNKETEKLVRSYREKYTLLKYLYNYDGRGASSSRNYGVERSVGDYVAFLDDDDIWLSEKLEKQIYQIKIQNLDAVFSKILIMYENTNISYATNATMPKNPMIDICMENFIGGTISSVIKRDIFNKIGGFDINFPAREEYDLWIRLIASGANISIVEEPLSVAFRSLGHRNRVSASVLSYEIAMEMLNIKHRKLINDTLSLSQKKIRTSRQYNFLAAQGVSIGLRISPFYYYMKSFMHNPSLRPFILAPIALLAPKILIRIRSKMGV